MSVIPTEVSYEHVLIDRAKWDIPSNRDAWYAAHPDIMQDKSQVFGGTGKLYNPLTGLSCCLGFLGQVCGITLEQLAEQGTPDDIPNEEDETEKSKRNPAWPEGLLKNVRLEKNELPFEFPGISCTTTEGILMMINDYKELDNEKREALIIKYGLMAGIKFEFTGKYLEDK